MTLFVSDIRPARFNNTKATQRSDDKDVIVIHGRILPMSEPYCRASFLIEIALPPEYPFKVPRVTFLDPIYHPNAMEDGTYACCCCTYRCCHRHPGDPACDYIGCHHGTNWKPTTSLADLIEDTIRIIDRTPDINNLSLNDDYAKEYLFNYSAFYEKALRLTLSYGRPRY
jgi:ubiquitin-protein ligase